MRENPIESALPGKPLAWPGRAVRKSPFSPLEWGGVGPRRLATHSRPAGGVWDKNCLSLGQLPEAGLPLEEVWGPRGLSTLEGCLPFSAQLVCQVKLAA